jgi:two-component system nitrogen regulation response regulator NtrX
MANVLIVDDERSYRKYISQRLTADGHTVETAATRAEGIAVGLALGPDVLIVDWMLDNGESGLLVADALRQRNPAIQAICITGFSAERVMAERGDSPIYRCIEKPFDLDDLADAVADALSEARRDQPT